MKRYYFLVIIATLFLVSMIIIYINKAWQDYNDAAHHPPIKNTPAAAYFISAKDGSIVSVIRGLTQAGMDLEVEGTKQNADGTTNQKVVYVSKIKNKSNNDYAIEWIEPFINPKIQSSIQGEISKTEINKIIPVHTELTVSGVFAIKSEQIEVNKDFVLGFIIKVKEENELIYIIDNYYSNGF